MIEIVFEKADTGFLRSKAKELGLEISIPRDIRQAQQLKDSGVPVPGDLEPEEAYLLQEITRKIGESGSVPDGFAVYLNDRTEAGIPEDVPTALWRQKKVAFNNLLSAVTEINSRIKK